MQLQSYDYLMIGVLAASTIFGFWKGLAWQVASVASLVCSYFLAYRFADRIAPLVSDHAPWNKFVAMLIVYAGASFFIWTAFRMVSSFIDRLKLHEFDKQMGALVGFGKGVLWCVAVTFFAVTLLGQVQRERIIGSKSGQYIAQLLYKADAVAPPEVKQVIGPYLEKINQRLDPNYRPNPGEEGLEGIQQLWQQQAARARQAVDQATAATTNWPAPSGGFTSPASGQGAPPTPAWPVSTSGERR